MAGSDSPNQQPWDVRRADEGVRITVGKRLESKEAMTQFDVNFPAKTALLSNSIGSMCPKRLKRDLVALGDDEPPTGATRKRF